MTGQEKCDLLIQVTALAGFTVYDNPYDTIKIIYKNGYNMNTTGRSGLHHSHINMSRALP